MFATCLMKMVSALISRLRITIFQKDIYTLKFSSGKSSYDSDNTMEN